MPMNVNKALILAAGRGRRLMPFTKDRPKCLVEVGGKPILYYQLIALQAHGISNVTMVIGYLGGKIKKYAITHFPRISFNFIKNDLYSVTNDIYSFNLAEKYCRNDFVQIDSDVLFDPDIIRGLILNSKDSSIAAIRKANCGEEEMKVIVDENGKVRRIGKALEPKKCRGEFMSISLFTKDFSKFLFPAMQNMIIELGPQMYSGDAMDKVIQDGAALQAFEIPAEHAIEIDFPEDIVAAERNVLKYVKIQ